MLTTHLLSHAASVQCGGEDAGIKASFKFGVGASGWVTEGEALDPSRLNCLTSLPGRLEGPHWRIGRVTICRRFAGYKGHSGVLHHDNASLQAFDKPQM